MPTAEISFANRQATGNQELAGAPGVAVNVVVDDTGSVRRRPGIAAIPGRFSGIVDPLGVTGLYETLGGSLYAIGGTPYFRSVYRVTGGSTPIGSGTGDSTLAGIGRPVFAETQLLLAIAGGGAMQKIVLASDASSRIADDPPYASHVVANSSRLLGNIAQVDYNNTFDKSVVRFSDIANGNNSYAGMEIWTEGLSTAGHFSAEANPDPVLAIAENTNEVFCFGTSSLQVFSPDPTAVYSPSTTKEIGCAAPYSVIKLNQEFAWFDNLRRFMLSDGRSELVLSDPIANTLDELETVSDCFGYRVVVGPIDAMVWTFPSDGRTFAFQKVSGWAEWMGWSAGNWAAFSVLSHHLQFTGRHDNLVGTSGGRVGQLSLSAHTDFGEPINARVETGYLARGTDARKHCKCVRLALRRGQTAESTAPIAHLSWRDQPGPWSPPLEISLGSTGETEPVVELRSLGIYRRRQWRFEFSGSEALELVSVTEEYDVLGN